MSPATVTPPGSAPLSPILDTQLHLRSYRDESPAHRHDFPQLVLPLAGRLELDIGGHQGCADSITAAFVEPGAAHATSAGGANRALVLDLAPSIMSDLQLESLARTPFVTLTAAAGKLVEFMALSLDQSPSGASLQHWVPLLLDTLARHPPQARSRLHRMLAQVEAQVARPWTVADMAALAAISPSRLHEWFQQELATSPRAWLAEVRMAQACRLLRTSALPLAFIAPRCGYGDQSALTHAMRKLRGTTPSAYRKRYLA